MLELVREHQEPRPAGGNSGQTVKLITYAMLKHDSNLDPQFQRMK